VSRLALTLGTMEALSVILVGAIIVGWLGLAALWWFGFRGRGP
jgi:hypothetical protein